MTDHYYKESGEQPFVVTRGVTFRDYGTAGMDRVEVCVEDGVITISQNLPDELNCWQALSLASMLIDAAAEMGGS